MGAGPRRLRGSGKDRVSGEVLRPAARFKVQGQGSCQNDLHFHSDIRGVPAGVTASQHAVDIQAHRIQKSFRRHLRRKSAERLQLVFSSL